MMYILFAGYVFIMGTVLVLIRRELLKKIPTRLVFYVIIAFAVGLTWNFIALLREHWIFAESSLIGVHLGIFPIEDLILLAGLTMIASAILVEPKKSKK